MFSIDSENEPNGGHLRSGSRFWLRKKRRTAKKEEVAA